MKSRTSRSAHRANLILTIDEVVRILTLFLNFVPRLMQRDYPIATNRAECLPLLGERAGVRADVSLTLPGHFKNNVKMRT
jgi:hypothetical protein